MLSSHLLLGHYRVLFGLLGRLSLVLRHHRHRRLRPLFLNDCFLFCKRRIRSHISFDHGLILLVIVSLRLSPSIDLHNVLDQFWVVRHL